MKATSLSLRYAKALADTVEKTGELPRVRQELLALTEAFSASPAIQMLVRTAAVSRDEKKALFGKLTRELDLSPHTSRLLEYLAEKKRAGLLPELTQSFAQQTDRRLGIRRGVLVAAMPLSDEQKRRVVATLERITRATVELRDEVDESLIAGFQVKLTDSIFDGSLRGQLQRMKERLAHGARTLHTA